MSLREDIAQVRVKSFIQKEQEFEFPQFIRGIRKCLGISRKDMSLEVGIHEMKIYYLESGKFKRFPEISVISTISDYFGIPNEVLLKKARIYLAKKHKS